MMSVSSDTRAAPWSRAPEPWCPGPHEADHHRGAARPLRRRTDRRRDSLARWNVEIQLVRFVRAERYSGVRIDEPERVEQADA